MVLSSFYFYFFIFLNQTIFTGKQKIVLKKYLNNKQSPLNFRWHLSICWTLPFSSVQYLTVWGPETYWILFSPFEGPTLETISRHSNAIHHKQNADWLWSVDSIKGKLFYDCRAVFCLKLLPIGENKDCTTYLWRRQQMTSP